MYFYNKKEKYPQFYFAVITIHVLKIQSLKYLPFWTIHFSRLTLRFLSVHFVLTSGITMISFTQFWPEDLT